MSIFDDSNAYGRTRVAAFRLDEQTRTLDNSDPAIPAFAEYVPAFSLMGLVKPESTAMGSAQLFPSGRILAGWGYVAGKPSVPDYTEFDSVTGNPGLRTVIAIHCRRNVLLL